MPVRESQCPLKSIRSRGHKHAHASPSYLRLFCTMQKLLPFMEASPVKTPRDVTLSALAATGCDSLSRNKHMLIHQADENY